jgi:hypothetical protein
MGDAPVSCPDPDLWIHVAAGTESPEVGAKFAQHAASCAACAAELREAIQLVGDGEDPLEDRFIAQLQSTQPAWQIEMAQRLSRNQALSQPARRTRLWRLPKFRLAAALAASVLAIGIVWFAIPRSKETPLQSAGPIARSASAQPLVAMLTLEPGTTRDLELSPQLPLTNSTQSAALTLLFPAKAPTPPSLKLLDSSNRVVWTKDLQTKDLQMAQQGANAWQVTVFIPASDLPAGGYSFALHVTDGGIDRVSDYAFSVTR